MWNDSVIESLRMSSREAIDLGAYGLRRLPLRTIDDRQKCIDALLPRIKYLPLQERAEAVQDIEHLCGITNLRDDLMMSTSQVRLMHDAGMEIGAHTVSHPILKSLSITEAESEISEGRKALQTIIDGPVDVFAYPNGKLGQDYDLDTVDIVMKQGFRGAVSTVPGVGRGGCDLFQLPRFTPYGKDMAVWGMRLALNQKNSK